LSKDLERGTHRFYIYAQGHPLLITAHSIEEGTCGIIQMRVQNKYCVIKGAPRDKCDRYNDPEKKRRQEDLLLHRLYSLQHSFDVFLNGCVILEVKPNLLVEEACLLTDVVGRSDKYNI
jgi:hypothetical protein